MDSSTIRTDTPDKAVISEQPQQPKDASLVELLHDVAPSPEQAQLRVVVANGIEQALEHIEKQYEQRPGMERRTFHTTEHTHRVVERTAALLSAIRQAEPDNPTAPSQRMILLGTLAAAYHDTVQEWQPKPSDPTKRERRKGYNEQESATLLETFVQQHQAALSITDEELQELRSAIETTEPGYDPTKNRVFQPKLTRESSVIARSLALADLATLGAGTIDELLRDGVTIFLEDNLDAFDTLTTQGLTSELLTKIHEYLLTQREFATGRFEQFQDDLQGLSPLQQDAVREMFVNFSSRDALDAHMQEFENMINLDTLKQTITPLLKEYLPVQSTAVVTDPLRDRE